MAQELATFSRVPKAQSDWLVQRLRSLGGSVEYFVYNERLAWQRLVDFLKRQLRSTQGKGVKGPNASRCHHCPVL